MKKEAKHVSEIQSAKKITHKWGYVALVVYGSSMQMR